MYSFNKKEIRDFKTGNSKCFLITNGIGGYACGSLINSLNRKHYGYLIASLHPPVDRVMILSKIKERIISEGKIINLDSNQYENRIEDNHQYTSKVNIDYLPKFYYETDSASIKKTIALCYGKNVCAIEYIINTKKDCIVELEPFFNYRDHGEISTKEDLQFEITKTEQSLSLIPSKNKNVVITLDVTEGELIENKNPYSEPLAFAYDSENGDSRVDYNYIPYHIQINCKKNEDKKIGIVVKVNETTQFSTSDIIKSEINRINGIVDKSLITDELGKKLVVASDAFIAHRSSTNLATIMAGFPWFTDWGRDTMIAFTGITLVTKRFELAKEILESFAKYEKQGLIPNMFPDSGLEPIYNTVDASLWYFYAAYKYVIYTGDYEFIKNKIYPVLKKIIIAYKNGTLFSIYMDKDYLIHAGSDQDQITWMDVRTHGVAVTPRHGKPVEINALWYNALMTMDYFSKKFDCDNDEYKLLAEEVKTNFNRKFYSFKNKCLFDVIDPKDDKIRPNQVFIFSLPFCVLDEAYQKSTFDVITNELYNKYGLRSLSPNDPEFKPQYTGSLDNRDYAYHMGTTWAFLIGGYIDGYAKVYKDKSTLKDELQKIVDDFIPHIIDGCIGGIAEVFDGKIAKKGKGCFSQAWSIGELLRSYYENILNKKS